MPPVLLVASVALCHWRLLVPPAAARATDAPLVPLAGGRGERLHVHPLAFGVDGVRSHCSVVSPWSDCQLFVTRPSLVAFFGLVRRARRKGERHPTARKEERGKRNEERKRRGMGAEGGGTLHLRLAFSSPKMFPVTAR